MVGKNEFLLLKNDIERKLNSTDGLKITNDVFLQKKDNLINLVNDIDVVVSKIKKLELENTDLGNSPEKTLQIISNMYSKTYNDLLVKSKDFLYGFEKFYLKTNQNEDELEVLKNEKDKLQNKIIAFHNENANLSIFEDIKEYN